MDSKHCRGCDQTLPLTAFYRSPSRGGRPSARCRPCHSAQGTRWKADNYPRVRAAKIQALYGLDAEAWDAMHAAQGGRCALCKRDPAVDGATGAAAVLHVDHDHVTGRVRALLCTRCNQGLGYFRDDPALLRAATAYIEEHARCESA